MKKALGILFSSRLMVIIVLMFAISIAIATFIENDFGSPTARAVVYNAWWFNLLLFIGIINLAGTIITGKLYRKEKLSIFLFHAAFLLILSGAAITRFFGFEGFMHIRTGESSNQIVSSSNYLSITAEENGIMAKKEKLIYFSAMSRNDHRIRLKLSGRELLTECLQIVPNAVETIRNDKDGVPMIELVYSGINGRQSVILADGQTRRIGEIDFSLNDNRNVKGVNISAGNDELNIFSAISGQIMHMATQTTDTLEARIVRPLQMKSLYNIAGVFIVPQTFFPAGKIDIAADPNGEKNELPDALFLKISTGMQSSSFRYFARQNTINEPVETELDGIKVKISYGARSIRLPFALELKQFILERYPGSNSPSWFESKIILNDQEAGIHEERRVYMNNILKYKGYRFYQSSYDTDELGTVLSVNHDYAGTIVTYAGYFLLVIGIVFSIFNRNSRFRKLSASLLHLRESASTTKLISVLIIALCSVTSAVNAQEVHDSVIIDAGHAAKFGELLIQDPAGRIKPANTLSSEFLRKVSRKTRILGQTPDQVMLGMFTHPSFWQDVPMIRVGHPEIQKILNIKEPYVSFSGVFDMQSADNPYVLSPFVNEAFQKKPASRNTFDTEMIRLDERINLCFQLYSGNLLRIFPRPNDPTHTWYSPANLDTIFTGGDSLFVHVIIPLYLQSLAEVSDTNTLIIPDKALNAIKTFQSRFGQEVLPSDFKIKLEIAYNRINVFDRVGRLYGLIGFILLIFRFIFIFLPRINLKPILKITTFLIYICFAIHLLGLAARWFISGHAPWSNGYESMVYIAFATVLAGLLFSRKSSITLAVTSMLAWLILFVAHLNWMDPQITNLVPVLKSYWLLIHVAIITASYGFLAMGALMAFINLILMTLQNGKNRIITGRIISEFSIVIEMTLIIGLYMLTIGTFLGGIWANESWGRYWGWDPKETWALVSVLIYAFVAHMRLVPGLKGHYIFNLMSLLAFSTIIMTYFGVNYYLSGLHSYAKGDPLPVPSFVYYTLAVVGLVALLSWENQRRLKQL